MGSCSVLLITSYLVTMGLVGIYPYVLSSANDTNADLDEHNNTHYIGTIGFWVQTPNGLQYFEIEGPTHSGDTIDLSHLDVSPPPPPPVTTTPRSHLGRRNRTRGLPIEFPKFTNQSSRRESVRVDVLSPMMDDKTMTAYD
ncbi:unnamed protein product [Trichobilharzia szidati]|nr:unnamed protein product [Trichobilharzia szidati]